MYHQPKPKKKRKETNNKQSNKQQTMCGTTAQCNPINSFCLTEQIQFTSWHKVIASCAVEWTFIIIEVGSTRRWKNCIRNRWECGRRTFCNCKGERDSQYHRKTKTHKQKQTQNKNKAKLNNNNNNNNISLNKQTNKQKKNKRKTKSEDEPCRVQEA
jgi:hypothetical protein